MIAEKLGIQLAQKIVSLNCIRNFNLRLLTNRKFDLFSFAINHLLLATNKDEGIQPFQIIALNFVTHIITFNVFIHILTV